jgi:hypothetical protein
MNGPLGDPQAWAAWLAHLKQWGWVPQGSSPGSNTLWGLPPPATNNNRAIKPVAMGTTLNSVPGMVA